MKKPPAEQAGQARRIAIAIELEQCVPWHQDCCEGILRFGEMCGWSCVIDPFLLGPEGSATAQGYDGVVGRIESDIASELHERGIPVVNHWNNSPVAELPSVLADLRAGARIAGEHLATSGFKQLACLGVLGDTTAQHMIEGLGAAATDAGLFPPASYLVDTQAYREHRRDWHTRFLHETSQWLASLAKPIGLFVGESTIARYTAQFAPHWGLDVPGDLGIVVWSDDVSTNAITPTLSVVDYDWFDVGYQSAALLDELMAGKAAHPRHRRIAPSRVITRDTTDVFICEDELVKEAMRYIAEHCRQELHIDDIAAALNTSRRTLYRKFDQVLGRSVKSEITRLRTQRLKTMLEETSQSLADIAASFGFSSPGQFSRYFTKATGSTPSAYRKRFGVKDKD